MTDELTPITPTEAVELYCDNRRNELAESTLTSHRRRLKQFLQWCDEENIENLNELSGRHLHRYRIWRRDDGDLNNVSLKTQMTTFKVFLKFCEKIDAVSEGLHTKVIMPDLSKAENTRDKKIEPEEAMDVLDYLREFERATQKHVTFEIMWHTGMRIGEIHALDVEDYHPNEAYIEIRHRPEDGTPLKNKIDGERLINLDTQICGLLHDYVTHYRHDVTDKNGRQPLLTTPHGRPSKTTIRKWVYKITRPCIYGGGCPIDRNPAECEATKHHNCHECPENINPHGIRRGAITYHLLRNWPEGDVSERMNVSRDVLEDHYDRRTDKEKLEQRRQNLSKL